MTAFRRPAALAGAVLILTLAACAAPAPPPPPPTVAGTVVDGPQCVAALVQANVAFDRIADIRGNGGCGVTTALSLYETPTTRLNRPVQVSCGLANALLRWDAEVLQPLARRVVGSDLVKVHHVGGYVCRGRSTDRSRLSEHAYGKAIDVIAFEFADGRMARVSQHWRDGGPLGRFLREASMGACGVFQVVLSPNADADHADHLHLDVGPWTLCRG